MFRSIVVAAIAAVISTSAVAQSYTGQIKEDIDGRYETVVVKPGDSVWGLCKQRQWCRFHYANTKNADAVDFLNRVSTLNDRANMDLIYPGDVIKFPLPFGTARAFDEQDKLRVALNKKAGELAEQNARKDGVIADLRKQINELTLQVSGLLGLNTDLIKTVVDLKRDKGGLEESLLTFKYLLVIVGVVLAILIIAGMYMFRTRREEHGSHPSSQFAPRVVRAAG